jgi:two-component system sensor histidine kinase CpxA
MRSLLTRILVTFGVALAAGTLVMFWVSAQLSRTMVSDLFHGMERMQLQQAQSAYETGGAPALRSYLTGLDGMMKGKRLLLDASGRDLLTGVRYAELAALPTADDAPPQRHHGELAIVRQSPDGRYRFVITALPPIPISTFFPYFAIAIFLVVVPGIWLSLGIVRPIRELSAVMNRFGSGQFQARAEPSRRDEIGDSARAFNTMAGRISTLMVAERRLLQDVSHELRSPLARLGFAAELMRTSPDPDAALARMKREITRLSQMVGTLLEMTSAEGDPDSHRMVPVEFGRLLQEVVEDCALEASARHVLLRARLDLPRTLPGDHELLRRCVENVLRNAIRYAPENTEVTVEADGTEHAVHLSVRDCGPGVPEQMLERIFDPFFRVEQSRDAAQGGVGLGLSIVRRVVQLHHGQIRARNAQPGLCIEITLPLAPGH